MTYISGTYRLKYFKEITNERGFTVRLEIQQRGYYGSAYQIDKLNGLSFHVQGGQDDATAPIVKTSLVFGLIDNAFLPYTDANGLRYDPNSGTTYKSAKWTEFYTSDSTLYLVKLKYSGVYIWSGYITPDSYSESLDSFGTVVITARDNIGHLQDFDFDMDGDSYGLVNIKDLVAEAMKRINLPMDLIFSDRDHDNELRSEDNEIGVRDLCVCADALKGKNWFNAVEEVLNSIGWVLRYYDLNQIRVVPIRHWPEYGWDEDDDPPGGEATFLGRGSGTRTYDPAYRRIVEKIDFGQNNKVEADMQKLVDTIKSAGTSQTSFIIEYANDYESGWNRHYATTNYLVQRRSTTQNINGVTQTVNGTTGPFTHYLGVNHLAPNDYAMQEGTEDVEGTAAYNYIFLAANTGTVTGSGTNMRPSYSNCDFEFYMKVMSPALKFKFEFAEHPMCFYDGKLGVYMYNLKKVIYYIKYVSADGNTTRYWNGYTWIGAQYDFTKEYDPLNEVGTSFENEMSECDDCGAYGTLYIVIRRMQYQAVGGVWTAQGFSYLIGYGCFARLRSFYIESAAAKVMKSDTITTVVNDRHNVKCERSPFFGCMPQSVGFAFPQNYENAFFYYDSDGNPVAAPYKWKWERDSVALPFPVKIHQQLLMFHYTTHEVLEGNARCDCSMPGQSDERLRYDALYFYKNVRHFLLSVNHNLLTDRFTSCIMRGFTYYDNLWSGQETQHDDGSVTL